MKSEADWPYRSECFLCNPDRDRIIFDSANFYGFLGLGPIVEGYLVVASRDHYKSILDLPPDLVPEYVEFKNTVKQVAIKVYGGCTITEHGRIPFCSFDKDRHDPHCYHAHQLVFPVARDFEPTLREEAGTWMPAKSLHEAKKLIPDDAEYLLYETDVGNILVTVTANSPRQAMRLLIAKALNAPEKADWKLMPGFREIETAKEKYNAMIRSL